MLQTTYIFTQGHPHDNLPTKKYLERLPSLFDIDLFSLNLEFLKSSILVHTLRFRRDFSR